MPQDSPPLLDEIEEVRIENRGLVFEGLRIDLDRITHVHVDQIAAAATGPIVMSVVGLVCLLSIGGEGGEMRAAIGGAMLGAAGIWWSQKKPTFRLVVRTTDEEFAVFEDSSDRKVEALRAAIAAALASSD